MTKLGAAPKRGYDLRGRRFGRLKVLRLTKKPDHLPGRGNFWLCQCRCGKKAIARGYSLTGGGTRSCGCKHVEQALRSGRIARRLVLERNNIRGQRFDSWLVLRHIGGEIWLCECICGNRRNVRRTNLTMGLSRSCGRGDCWRKARGRQPKESGT
jgi:hypothetical protein